MKSDEKRREETLDMKRIATGLLVWTAMITGLHAWLNVSWSELLNDRLPIEKRKLNVAYIPVT
jgi:hypothetical protein